MNEFGKFMNRKLAEYHLKVGHVVTVTDFALLLGVHQGDLSHWLKGRRPPQTIQAIRKLAANPLIGPEVWKASGIMEPMPTDPVFERALRAMEALPSDLQEHYLESMEQDAEKNKEGQSRVGTGEFQFAS